MSEACCHTGSNRLILACAGSANTGQMTYRLALQLTREGQGSLFCLAGIGAHLSGFVASARDAEDMLVLDGCPLACASRNLLQANIPVRNHFIMTEFGVKKQHGKAPTAGQTAKVKEAILNALPPSVGPTFPLAP
ncbi:MAG TPA: putative zinc-binding protein [Syntrophales bacterium]|nr:putative zinc-binding protein [Syntrophales bacterium]